MTALTTRFIVLGHVNEDTYTDVVNDFLNIAVHEARKLCDDCAVNVHGVSYAEQNRQLIADWSLYSAYENQQIFDFALKSAINVNDHYEYRDGHNVISILSTQLIS